MAAPLNVGVPLDVAALGNVIDCVDVIDAVRRSDQRAPRRGCSTVNGVDHGYAVVPVPERGYDHDGDHVHGAPEEVPLGGVDHVSCGDRPERKPMKQLDYCCMS